ncbi:MAG: HIT domain-containing protein [Candidatus Omnitrophica bacterium]|nr:HIT domain-containing protein [Candidatus Omnitrophota bacterium]MCK5260329.1 HIT domain-containing protein [Candidatus Omnitrophota bacterium]
MDKLWAPWRIKYVTKIGKKARGCVFCAILKEKKDKTNFIITRTKHSYAVLNLYPYNNGHILIMPNRHVADLGGLRKEEREDLMDLLEATKKLLDKHMKADGYNIGINLGRAAGAGFPKHVHIHLVPRWQGDVNFMPVTGQTKVISQSLQALYKKLTKAKKARKR